KSLYTSVLGDGRYLDTVFLPETLEEIKLGTFRGCISLKSITIPSGVRLIDEMAFFSCFELVTVSFPSNLKIIEGGAFWRCEKLTSAILPEGLEIIGKAAFQECYELSELVLPSTLDSIAEFAFNNTSLRSVVIPEKITRIEEGTFKNGLLDTVTILGPVTYIGKSAFHNYYSIPINFRMFSSEPPFIESNINAPTFHYSTYDNGTLYVPQGSYQAYAESSCTRYFQKIIEDQPSSFDKILQDGELTVTSVGTGSLLIQSPKEQTIDLYNLSGKMVQRISLKNGENRMEGLSPGLYFIQGNKVRVQ
ncbi:MAG: leucine-rich repeat protein, partial [Odoribacter sp.]|nr:leucine-rich repeat protein [Odoribacter sp.]